MDKIEKFLLWYLITDEDVDPTLKGFANAIRLSVPFWLLIGLIVL